MKKLLAVSLLLIGACNPQQAVPPANSQSAGDAASGRKATATEYKITGMSPSTTKAGSPFNVQPDQGSGISFQLNRPVPPGDIRITFDGKPLNGVATNGVVITATVPVEYLGKPGSYAVAVQLPGSSSALPAGDFTVE